MKKFCLLHKKKKNMKFIIIKESIKLFVMLMGPIIAIPSIVMCYESNIIKFGKYLIFGDEFENISKKVDCLGDKINDLENKIDNNNNSVLTTENAIYVTCGIIVVGVIVFIVYLGYNGGIDGNGIKEGFESVVDGVSKCSANIIEDNHKNLSEVVKLSKSLNENISLSSIKSTDILSSSVGSLTAINDNLTQIIEGLERNEKLICERVLPKLIALLSSKIIQEGKDSLNNEVEIIESETINDNSIVLHENGENEVLPRVQSDITYGMLGDLTFSY